MRLIRLLLIPFGTPAALALLSACAHSLHVREFPNTPVVWHLDDQRPFFTPPEKVYSPFVWDALDYSLFHPISQVWLFKTRQNSRDVNALDEVANSSWFTNRLSTHTLTPGEVQRGACADTIDEPKTPWLVVGGKPDGANPGFIFQDTAGRRGLLKVDGVKQPERASAADVIGALIFHAAGYYVPCNRVYFIGRDDLRLQPGATVHSTRGTKTPVTLQHVTQVLDAAFEAQPGRYRVAVSEFIEGEPRGPWRYDGTTRGDPNDRIPHEFRRSNRGMRIFASWIGHIDTRQENTLLSWIRTSEDQGYLRHYRVDFGDALGVLTGFFGVAERLGHTGYLDFGQAANDFATLGLQNHPWHEAKLGPAGTALGFFSDHDFDPEKWEPGYPNPAFDAAEEADFAWAARILARLGPPYIAAILDRAHIQNPLMQKELTRILIERRRRILERYLTHLSPLAWPTLQGHTLRLEDLLIDSGLRTRAQRSNYEARLITRQNKPHTLAVQATEGAEVTIELPHLPDTYGVLVLQATDSTQEFPLWIHLDSTDRETFEIRGLERPTTRGVPVWP